MIESKMKEINIFFCTGSPKSGTTFLQIILNTHPEISCPPEHRFDFFVTNLPKLFETYNKILEHGDKTTANQGPIFFDKEDIEDVLAFIIKKAAIKGARNKKVKWYGIKDNWLTIQNLYELYNKLFPKSRFIFIIRDPRSVAISSWYWLLRVEPGFLETRGKNKEHWANQVAEFWLRENSNMLRFYKKNFSKILICKYEDLVLQPFENYKKIFEFLEVDTKEETINKIIEKTSFKKFKDGKFFRKASIDEWKKELPPSGIKIIETKCVELMKYFKYEFFICKHL